MKKVRKICNICKKDIVREGRDEYCACYLYYHEDGIRKKKRLCLDCAKILEGDNDIRCARCQKEHKRIEKEFNIQSNVRRSKIQDEKN